MVCFWTYEELVKRFYCSCDYCNNNFTNGWRGLFSEVSYYFVVDWARIRRSDAFSYGLEGIGDEISVTELLRDLTLPFEKTKYQRILDFNKIKAIDHIVSKSKIEKTVKEASSLLYLDVNKHMRLDDGELAIDLYGAIDSKANKCLERRVLLRNARSKTCGSLAFARDILYNICMSMRKVSLVSGEYYHIFNRGNSKQKIFLDDKDRDRFLKLLYLCNSKQSIDFREQIVRAKINAWDFEKGTPIVFIGAWVLMPNHFHLYLTANAEARLPQDNAIIIFIHKTLTAYSKYFNAKYNRTGSLFEGKFKSVHINKDNQAKYLFSYIHLNPLKLINTKWKEEGIKDKKKAINFLDSYKWSSYFDYLIIPRIESKIINRDKFLNYFQTKKLFQRDIFDWIEICGSKASAN